VNTILHHIKEKNITFHWQELVKMDISVILTHLWFFIQRIETEYFFSKVINIQKEDCIFDVVK